jgi:hypothetical protein
MTMSLKKVFLMGWVNRWVVGVVYMGVGYTYYSQSKIHNKVPPALR